jgi:uncharacterized protein YciI
MSSSARARPHTLAASPKVQTNLKSFIVEVTYRIPADQLGEIRTEHRAFLRTGYERGWLLCSGPTPEGTGGMVVARAPSLEDLKQFFMDDPYHLKGVAEHRFVEFNPVLYQDFIKGWIACES